MTDYRVGTIAFYATLPVLLILVCFFGGMDIARRAKRKRQIEEQESQQTTLSRIRGEEPILR